jgi:hypothetical protein
VGNRVGQQLEGESLAFDPSSALGADAVEQLRGPVSPETAGRAAGDELRQDEVSGDNVAARWVHGPTRR